MATTIATLIMSSIMKFLDVNTLCTLIAKAIACILSYASKKGGKAWDIAKDVITKINLWTSLFMQVYEDDNMSEHDEKLIAEAIKKETSIEKLVDILKKEADKKNK